VIMLTTTVTSRRRENRILNLRGINSFIAIKTPH
jgi:hypothetical protein